MASQPALYEAARDVLQHYYDYAYLLQHALVARVAGASGDDPMGAVQRVRRMLLQLVERLRPTEYVDTDDPAWRPYLVLHHRYILGRNLGEVMEELGLGERQIQREQGKGFAALAVMIEEELQSTDNEGAPERDPLREEIRRAASPVARIDVGPALEGAVRALRPLAQEMGVPIHLAPVAKEVVASGSLSLVRQLLITTLSTVLRLPGVRAIDVAARGEQLRCLCVMLARPDGVAHPSMEAPVLPETVVALAEAQDIRIQTDAAPGALSVTLDLPAHSGSYSIAIIEDNKDLSTLFARYLAPRGYRVTELANTPTIVRELADLQPDAVVLDVMMSGPDGWELLESFRRDRALSNVPILVCSVLDQPELAKSLGATAYLRKPVRPPELAAALAALLRNS